MTIQVSDSDSGFLRFIHDCGNLVPNKGRFAKVLHMFVNQVLFRYENVADLSI